MANDFKENLSRGIAALETRLYGHNEELEKVMAGYNPSSFCAGFIYAMTLVKGLLTQMPDAVEVVRCKDCLYCKANACIRKVNRGGVHSIDRVHANFFCAAGKRRSDHEAEP